MRLALFLLAAAIQAAPAEAACTSKDVTIAKVTMDHDAGWFTVTGQLISACPQSLSAELRFTFRDAAGQVVSEENDWMPGRGSFSKGAALPFTFRTRAYATAKTVDVRIVSVEFGNAR